MSTNLGNLKGKINILTSITNPQDLMIPDEAGFIKFPFQVTDQSFKFEDKDYGELTVNGKVKRVILWKKIRENYSANYAPEIKKGELMLWGHIVPDKPKVTIDFGETVAN